MALAKKKDLYYGTVGETSRALSYFDNDSELLKGSLYIINICERPFSMQLFSIFICSFPFVLFELYTMIQITFS